MNTVAFLLLCIQACLVQRVFSQCLGRLAAPAGCAPGAAVATGGFGNPGLAAPYGSIGGYGYSGIGNYGYGALGGAYGAGLAGPYGAGLAGPYGLSYGLAEYGGAGEGNVGVAGELPVAGATAVAGQVPILGAVRFGGDVCAGGAVSIAGNCACGCGCGTPYGAPLGAAYAY